MAPPFQISPFEENELPEYSQVQLAAFPRGIGTMLTGPPTPANIAALEAKALKDFKTDPNATFLKAVDLQTGRVAACAKWCFNPGGWTEEELDEQLKLKEGRIVEHDPLYIALGKACREIMGNRPYGFINYMFTHPDFERKGAGSLLMQWGTDKADELGIECYVESSPEGEGLYKKFGFRIVKELSFDLKDCGRPDLGMDLLRLMVRPAKAKG